MTTQWNAAVCPYLSFIYRLFASCVLVFLAVRDIFDGMALRVGIIGLGRIGCRQLRCAQAMSTWKIPAVADPHSVGTITGSAPVVYADWEQMLVEAEIDAVSICTPHHSHASIALAALRAGKHVLVEKPISLSVAEAQSVVDTANRHHAVFMVELTHRFYPPFVAARNYLHSGHLGRVYAIADRIVEPVSSQIAPWLLARSSAGGGVAMTNGFHMLDRIAAITGQSLRYICGAAGYSARLGDIEDTAAMFLALDDGTPVQLFAAWPKGSGGVDDELTIYGTRGTLRVWAWRGWRVDPIDSHQPSHEDCCYPDDMNISDRVDVGVRGAMGEFADAIVAGRTAEPSAEDALRTQHLIDTFYQNTACRGGLG